MLTLRKQEIIRTWKAYNKDHSKTAREFGISRQRVHQICGNSGIRRGGKTKIVLDDSQRAELSVLADDGLPLTAIVESTGIRYPIVRRTLVDMGYEITMDRKRKLLSPDERIKLAEMADNGYSLIQMVKPFNTSHRVIRRILVDMGYEIHYGRSKGEANATI